MKTKGRVIIGMSGGVDSSVAAALLKNQGYDVIGVYILGWTGTKEFPCNWQTEESDARKVAEQLDIPFYTINLSKEYEQAVIDDFFANYRLGLTPNPDILCNREIKFKALWKAVRQFEPDFLATGHYARIKNAGTPDAALYKGVDENKDQSYFLWGIDEAMLSNILMPIGELKKPQVRALAKKYDLATATKKDSQGICFIGPLKVRQFLTNELKPKPGVAMLPDGRQVARHDGAALYTIGQRLGAGSVDWSGDAPPLFVIAKDIKRNLLMVGSDRQTFASSLVATKSNWLSAQPKSRFAAAVKIRYRQEDVNAKISCTHDQLDVTFNEPVRAITPGQSVVFYAKDGQLLGGAVIQSVPEAEKLLRQVNAVSAKTQS